MDEKVDNQKPCVYFLYSEKDKRTYVGSTINLLKRLQQHNNGLVPSTRNRRPLQLVYQEEFGTIEQARTREKYFKTAAGRRAMKKLFQEKITLPHDRNHSPASP